MLSVQSFLIATWRWGWFKRFSTSKSLLGARLKSAPIEGRQVACFRFPLCHHSCVVCTPNVNQKKGMTLVRLDDEKERPDLAEIFPETFSSKYLVEA
jgi:hypothetical protein